jgi:preprotein translocase subunit SecE
MALNREQKRMLKKQGDLGEDGNPAASKRTRPAAKAPAPNEQRTTPKVFLKEMRAELRKVAWPSRSETLNYSAVVATALVFLTALIFGLDTAFSWLVLKIFNVQ